MNLVSPPSMNTQQVPGFLLGGGEMGRLIAAYDWATTPLGPLENWPQSLCTSVSLMLNSQHPMWIGWGRNMTFLYNDAYVSVLSLAKHPWALGRPASEVWAEIWHVCLPLADKVFDKGEASFMDDVQLFMSRGSFLEETYYSFSYSPIRDESGAVGGLFCPSAEVSSKVLNTRRLATLAELGAKALIEKTVAGACATAFATFANNPADIPFALFYQMDPGGSHARLAGVAGLTLENALACPVHLPLAATEPKPWPVAEVMRTGRARQVSVAEMTDLPLGMAGQPLVEAIALPLTSRGDDRPLGVLVAGINPTRRLDTEYRTFFELLAGQLAAALQNARAAEEDKRRADALAELDRAKTTFFSNVSHELRTPLTLMMGPVEDLLRQPDGVLPEGREMLSVVHRNSLRLLKLVNTLLDFSRIEAGRIEAVYEPTHLAASTAELASAFRSAIERAGLRFTVDCPPLTETAYVDREMWEKIVFNLLSNALKFTLAGEITITLRSEGGAFVLSVRDTGAGIPATELPRIFERFHRVRGTQSRTHEGTGIGLALVRELAFLHGGEATVSSEEGKGSVFKVALPHGSAHLPQNRLGAARTLSSTGTSAQAFVAEAGRWTAPEALLLEEVPDAPPQAVAGRRARIVLADDNSDMRDYVHRLLVGAGHQVIAVPDGLAALEAARIHLPDLVLSDVMMPRLDGLGLVRGLRDEPATATTPIILLSARAGEESRIEGVAHGADDYLTKPFSARELLARVKTHLELARVRRDAAAALRQSEEFSRRIIESSRDCIKVLDREGRLVSISASGQQMLGIRDAGEVLGRSWLTFWSGDDLAAAQRALETALGGGTGAFDGSFVNMTGDPKWWDVRITPILNAEGQVSSLLAISRDVTERRRMEDALRGSHRFLQSTIDALSSHIAVLSAEGVVMEVNAAWKQFADLNGFMDASYGVGTNYLELLERQVDGACEELAAARGIRAVIAGQQPRFQIEYPCHSPTAQRWFLMTVTPFAGSGAFQVVVAHEDITERVLATIALREAKEQAERASRAKDTFLAQLSHELRTPLTPVLMTAAALREQANLPDEVREDLAMIERNVALEARLIDDLLDLTRISQGKLSLRAESCDVHLLIRLVVGIVRDEAREKRIELNLSLDAKRAGLVADAPRLQQVFWNLLRNAVKFTQAGGRVHLRTYDIADPGAGAEATRMGIEVLDNGIGFAADDAERIFEPFEQTLAGQQHRSAGLGLGLAIARAVVKLHQGELRAESQGEGQGAVFTVELPGSIPVEGIGPSVAGRNGESVDALQEAPLRLLLVEDHAATLKVLSRLLRRSGHSIVPVSTVTAAREAAAAHTFDGVVSDLGLPDGTGIELMEHLRAAYGLRGIALSGYGMEEDLRRSEAAGFVAHLVKPIDSNELRRVLRRFASPA